MAWDRAPTYGADIQAWYFVRQYYHAIGEKGCALFGSFRWPAYNVEYDFGTIEGVIGGSGTFEIIDGSKDWSGFPAGCSGDSRWFNVHCDDDPNTPPFYDVVIEVGGTADETMIVRAQIVGGTSDSLIISDSIVDYVTAGIISDVSDIVGKRYAIIRRDGLFWSDKDDDKSRWPSWPNGFPSQQQIDDDGATGSQELWRGEVNSARSFSLTDETDRLKNLNCVQFVPGQLQQWPIDKWKFCDALFYRSDGYLARAMIIGNNKNTLFFDSPTYDLTIGGTIEVGDVFTLLFETKLGSTTISIDADSTTIADVAEQIALELLGSLDPILVDLSLDVSASGDTLTITADGGWFTVTPSTTEEDGTAAVGQTFTLDAPDVSEIVATGQYSIGEPLIRAFPGRTSQNIGKPFWWYGGYQEQYESHLPDDTLFPLRMPVTSITILQGTEGDCEDTTLDAFDIDVHTQPDEECAEEGGDHFFAPHLYKTGRARQGVLESLIATNKWSDLDRADTNPGTAYVLATAFEQAFINNLETTITGVSSGDVATIDAITIPKETPLAATPSSRSAYFAIIDDDDSVMLSGAAEFTSTSFTFAGVAPEHVGKELILSWGWSRNYPRQFARYYPATCFIPDVDSGEEGETVIDPPSVVDLVESGCFGVGQWIRREPSGSYLEYNVLGFASETAKNFIANEYARYIGTHWALPDVGFGPSGSMTVKAEDASLDLPYWDHFTVSKHLPVKQVPIDESKSGQASAGGNNWLRDDDQNWYASVWYDRPSGDVMRSETGTATSGTVGRIVDTSKTNNVAFETHCFWQTSRFINFDGAYVNFPIKITQTRGSSTIEWRSFITATNQTSGSTTIDFEPIAGMDAIAGGDTYVIDEPYEINRWENRRLRITKADGTILETRITHSDDRALFFDDLYDGAVVDEFDAYSIVEVMPGTVHKWTGSEWIEPLAGTNDPRGPTPGLSTSEADGVFRDPTTLNLPTTVTAFGKIQSNDYTGLSDDEMYRVLNLLRHTVNDYGWTANGEDNICFAAGSSNYVWDVGGSLTYHSLDEAWQAFIDQMQFEFDEDLNPQCGGPGNQAPRASLISFLTTQTPDTHVGWGNVRGTANQVNRSYAYAKIEDLPICLPSSVDFYAYSTIDAADHDEGVVDNFSTCIGAGGSDPGHKEYNEFHFDNQSTPLLYRQWALVDSLPVASIEDRTSSVKVGDDVITFPEWKKPADPVPHIGDCGTKPNGQPSDATSTVHSGFYIPVWKAIVKWESGMRYLDI